jgi:hypothetical protein
MEEQQPRARLSLSTQHSGLEARLARVFLCWQLGIEGRLTHNPGIVNIVQKVPLPSRILVRPDQVMWRSRACKVHTTQSHRLHQLAPGQPVLAVPRRASHPAA